MTGVAQAAPSSIERAYSRLIRRRILVIAGLSVLCVLTFLTDVFIGSSGMTVTEMLTGILWPSSVSDAVSVIIWDIRLAYGVMAILVGAALALAGAELQTVLDNPLASPLTLGITSAATFGAALGIIIGAGFPGIPSDWLVPANAFALSLGSVLVLQAVSRLRGTGPETIVLFGIAFTFAFNGLVALLQFVATAQATQQLVFWILGSLTRADWSKIAVLALAIAATLPFSLAASWRMTALRLGADRAMSFGINVRRLRLASLFRVAVLTGTAIAFVGNIGFIGLVGPHIARLLVGEDHRFLLPTSALSGALLMSAASVASKLIAPGVVMPVGIVTAIVGVPVFIGLLLARRERGG